MGVIRAAVVVAAGAGDAEDAGAETSEFHTCCDRDYSTPKCMYTCAYIYTYVCMYVCMYMYTHTHTHMKCSIHNCGFALCPRQITAPGTLRACASITSTIVTITFTTLRPRAPKP